MDNRKIILNVNDRDYTFTLGVDFQPEDTLSTVLRNNLGLTGVRVSCEQGACGACTILLDGASALSCMMLAVEAEGHEIKTIESFSMEDDVVKSIAEMSEPGYGTATQCGFCTPGFVLEAHSLLNKNPDPTKEEITEEMSGHICRCGCYHGVVHAVENVVEERKCDCKEGHHDK